MARDWVQVAIVMLRALGTALEQSQLQLPAPVSSRMPTDPVRVLAATIWGEARDDSTAAQFGVAAVVMNRVARPGAWGNSVVSVCLAPGEFPCWWGPQADRVRAIDERDVRYYLITEVAERVLAGDYRDDTGGADHFYRAGVNIPFWAERRQPTKVIGELVFFRLGASGKDLPGLPTRADEPT